jgi:hypothetical protein
MHTTTAALRRRLRPGALLSATMLLATACVGSGLTESAGVTSIDNEAVNAEPTAQPPVQGLLRVEPVSGHVEDTFTVSGGDFPEGAEVEFIWNTSDGGFETVIMPETVEFHRPTYADKHMTLGYANADSQGRVSATFTAPEDYGGVHDIFAVVDGEPVARGGFQINRRVTVSPSEGPVGTLITIAVTGLGSHPLEQAMAVRYGNQYVGYITGVTTHGTSLAQIRAAGPPGLYNIELSGLGIHGGGYLNNQQSPYAHLFPETGSYRFEFSVTGDEGPPANTLEWPDDDRVVRLPDDATRTTATGLSPAHNVNAVFEPAAGPVLTVATLRASGLTADRQVELIWVTARGNRVTPSGWEFHEIPIGTISTNAAGAIETSVEIPDGLGGWHVVRLVQDRQVVAEVPFYVEQSLVVTPDRVRLGDEFTITLKGIGWTEIDNTVAITYNNAYTGYACGFNSDGDITIHLQAVGQPGTHLIDIYPTTYQGQGKRPWGFQMPHLSALTDHPSLDIGYMLPIYRLSFEVFE